MDTSKIIKTKKYKLYNDDNLFVLNRLKPNLVDLVITSPPYDNLRTYEDTCNWNYKVFKQLVEKLYIVVKEGGVIVWVVKDATVNMSKTLTSFKQALYFKKIGFNIHYIMIWEKQTSTDTGSLKVRYGNNFEYMFVIVKGKIKTFNPIMDRKNTTYGRKKHGTIRQVDGSMKLQSCIGKLTSKYGQRFNIWKINTCVSNIERTGHPAQFPVQLAYDHILSWSNKNDIVLDPFMGSGTTGVACMKLQRRFIGIEIVKKYFNDSVKRIKEAGSSLVNLSWMKE